MVDDCETRSEYALGRMWDRCIADTIAKSGKNDAYLFCRLFILTLMTVVYFELVSHSISSRLDFVMLMKTDAEVICGQDCGLCVYTERAFPVHVAILFLHELHAFPLSPSI